jgi:hypothetical protein
MAISLTTITNVSTQVVPILVDPIDLVNINANATIPYNEARQLQLAPGSEAKIETQRIDIAQLQQLRKLRMITFTTS